MKRTNKALFLTIFTLITLHSLPALGVGLHRDWNLLGDTQGSLALNISGETLPLILKIGGALDSDSPSLIAAIDYHPFRLSAGRAARLYAGAGIRAELGDRTLYGIEFPAGIGFYPLEVGELFCEIAPSVGITLDGTASLSSGMGTLVGFRIHF